MTKMTTMIIETADLQAAYASSYYTIIGVGGELADWIDGYNGLLAQREVGTPMQWFQTTGADVNLYARSRNSGAIKVNAKFDNELVLLMFKLDGLNLASLAMFKIMNEDRWFDDIVSGMMTETESDEDDD
jgi:hypothetical protein